MLWLIERLLKLSYRHNAIPIKVLADFFCRNWQDDPKIPKEMQATGSSKNNFEKEQNWKTHISQFWNLPQCYEKSMVPT